MASIRGLNLSLDENHGDNFRIAIIHAQWNSQVVDELVSGCMATLTQKGVCNIVLESVGGAFELPLAASALAKSGKFNAIIAIGCLIKGATMHFEYISSAAVDGLMRVSLDNDIPVINGILNVLTEEQALERAGLSEGHSNEGVGWANTAILQARLVRKYSPSL